MRQLAEIRAKLDEIPAICLADSNFIHHMMTQPEQALGKIGILQNDIPLYAWSPLPSSITACPTCLLKPTPTAPHTHADCPPRPNPSPSPSPNK